jgi:hypothetical protein
MNSVPSSAQVTHVHVTTLSVATAEMTPPHDERIETPTYRKARAFLIDERDAPCAVCGVRKSTLHDPAQNPLGATALETHHYPIERSLLNAVDPKKLHARFPQVFDDETLVAFIDSPANLIVLCDQHHRSPEVGIHHLVVQDWMVLPFLKTGYRIVARPEDAQQAMATDEAVMVAQSGKEAK